MPVITYIFDKKEAKKYCRIKDEELRDLRDEIHHKGGALFFVREYTCVRPRFLRKNVITTKYSVLVYIHSCEYQILNFAKDDSSSHVVDKACVINFFLGMLCGLEKANKLI